MPMPLMRLLLCYCLHSKATAIYFRSTGLHCRTFRGQGRLQEHRDGVRLPLPLQGHMAQRLHWRPRHEVVRHEGRPADQGDVAQLLGSVQDDFVSDWRWRYFPSIWDRHSEFWIVRQGCSGSQFKCDNGLCIESTRRCDRVQDCLGGEDESKCRESKSMFTLYAKSC